MTSSVQKTQEKGVNLISVYKDDKGIHASVSHSIISGIAALFAPRRKEVDLLDDNSTDIGAVGVQAYDPIPSSSKTR